MRFLQAKPISDNLIFIGDEKTSMYLLKGERYLIVGGGMSYVVPAVEEQLNRFNVDRSRIMGILILHSHFDHITAVPYFKQAYPWLEIMASAGTKKVLGIEKAVKSIVDLDQATRQSFGVDDRYRGISLEFKPPEITKVLNDGDIIDLGGEVSVSILETPGHSKCSIAAYVPAFQYLFPSDGVPLPILKEGRLMLMANDNIVLYLKSLERMAALDVKAVCCEHGGAFYGEYAASFLRQGLELTRKKYDFYRQAMQSGADAGALARDELAQIAKDREYSLTPEEVLRGVFTRMITSAAG
jgi:glyoxylase-like metal-dependent hydrolase (beta-lactamase superfamily II)